MKLFYTLVFCSIQLFLSAQTVTLIARFTDYQTATLIGEGNIAVLKDGKYGMVDKVGNVILQAEYESISNYNEGACVVQKNQRFGAVNKKGGSVVPLKYFKAGCYQSGLCMMEDSLQNLMIMDKSGLNKFKHKSESETDYIGDFYGGIARASISGKYIFINKKGEEIFVQPPGTVYNCMNGMIRVMASPGTYYYLSATGKIVTDTLTGWYDDFSDGYALFSTSAYTDSTNNTFGYIDASGKTIIVPEFDQAQPFSEGIAAVKKDGLVYYIDKSGHALFGKTFDYAGGFSGGMALVNSGGRYFIINSEGTEILDLSTYKTTLNLKGVQPYPHYKNGLLIVEIIRFEKKEILVFEMTA